MAIKLIKLLTELLVTILVLTSCSTKQLDNPYNEKTEQPTDDFSKYLKSLKKLEVPFTIDKIDEEPTGYDSALFVKFKHRWSSWPYGQVIDNGQVISTIEVTIGEDRFAPVIMTYTKEGQKLDSLLPHKKSGWDIDYLSKEYVTINRNKEIIVIDSTTKWELSDEMDRIDDSKRNTTDTVIYKIDELGKITIVKGKLDE